MTILNTYDVILENATEEYALEYARGMVWCEVETTVQTLHDSFDLIDVIDGVGVYYDYSCDSYCFTNEEEV